MQIYLANPRGFCAGVDRAITIVDRALDLFGPPIYVKHEVVHNRFVVDGLKARGAIFVEDIHEIPDNTTAIFSAHGVSQAVRQAAQKKNLKIFDATCPLVTKVHMEVARYARLGYECILIGHAGHPEVEGTLGQYNNANAGIYLVQNEHEAQTLSVRNPLQLALTTQTTLSVDDTLRIIDILRKRFPHIQEPRKDDICYATQNRQDAVKALVKQCEVVLVVGSPMSSNSNRLKEVAERAGRHAYLIDNASEIDPKWVKDIKTIGVTAGASAPEILVQDVITRLHTLGGFPEVISISGMTEDVTFMLPKELRDTQ